MFDLLTRASTQTPPRYTATFPAPVGGLNFRDAISEMDPKDALILDNYFPESNYIELRNGSSSHATGITGDVESLMEWSGPANRKLFAANSSAVYNVTSAGAVGAAEFSGQTNGRWQHTMMATAGGNFLCMCNGADAYRTYDGTSWATPAITNVSGADLINIALHKSRLWFVEKNSTSAWYLPVNSISGAATELDLGPQFKLGGKLQLIGTLSRDAGDGSDDFIAFISSRGEMAVYQGTDPSSASTWEIVGRYRVGAPVGDRALLQVAGDLALISQDGVVSLMQMINLDRSAAYRASVTNKIDDALAAAFQNYGSNFGWQTLAYPKGHYALINVPVSTTSSWQYVMNTQTGAWCRFTGQYAKCWSLLGDDLYFGGSGVVRKADTGTGDAGANIVGEIQGAFQYFRANVVNKHFKMIRPIIVSNGGPAVAMRLVMDFGNETPSSDDVFQATISSGSLWGSALWGIDTWGGSSVIFRNWYATYGLGTAASVRIKTETNNVSIRFNSFDTIYERASGMAL